MKKAFNFEEEKSVMDEMKVMINGFIWNVRFIYNKDPSSIVYNGRANPRIKTIELSMNKMVVKYSFSGKSTITISKDYFRHIVAHELTHALLYSTGNYEQTCIEDGKWGKSEVVVDWIATNLKQLNQLTEKVYKKGISLYKECFKEKIEFVA